jgi:putative ABC transport system permease protein
MLWNALLLSLREIRRNVMRSFLTVLGIVIGVAAVITMVTIGKGATAQVQQQVAAMGSNLLVVTPGKRQMGPNQGGATAVPFKLKDAEAIAKEVRTVAAVAPASSRSVTAVFGNQNWSTSTTGTDSHYFKVVKRPIRMGRPFSDSEVRSGAAVCVLGETVRNKLFGERDGLGEKIRLKKLSFQVIGVMEAKGQNAMGADQDDIVVIPLRTFQRRIAGNQDVSMIQVSVKDGSSTEKAQADIGRLMRERRHLVPGEEDNFSVMDMKEIASVLGNVTKVLTILLGAVAAVSLLVGGIGIMNIMLVSVTERTREIGIRLAIGALESEVLLQFLVEAVVLSSLGGLVGVVLAVTSCVWLTTLMRVPYVLSTGIVITAFVFSAVVGVVFGYFPAVKAARMDPIEALRHE